MRCTKNSSVHGKVFLKSPGRMRWDYKGLHPRYLWQTAKPSGVRTNQNQAYQRPLTDSQLPVAIRFLMGQGDLLAEFLPFLMQTISKSLFA